jgi:hypothetical protein
VRSRRAAERMGADTACADATLWALALSVRLCERVSNSACCMPMPRRGPGGSCSGRDSSGAPLARPVRGVDAWSSGWNILRVLPDP